MRVREECDIIIDRHPHYKSLNKKLMEDVYSADYPEDLSHEDHYKFYAKHSSYNTLTDNVKIINCGVSDKGGAIWVGGSTLNIVNSQLLYNYATQYNQFGGAIGGGGGNLSIDNSIIAYNISEVAAGIYYSNGNLEISNSNIIFNYHYENQSLTPDFFKQWVY